MIGDFSIPLRHPEKIGENAKKLEKSEGKNENEKKDIEKKKKIECAPPIQEYEDSLPKVQKRPKIGLFH